MARSAILAIRIVSNSTDAERGLDKTSRAVDKLGKSAAREAVSVQRMNQQFDRMSTAALKVGALGTAAMSATSRVAGLVQAMAPLAGFAAVLPGALVAGAAGMATFKVATSGLSDALKASAKGAKEFEEATADMAPAMRDSVREMVKVNEQFGPTKRATQEAFWSGMSGAVRGLATAYLPQVHKGMVGLAESSNRFARALADGLTQGAKFGAVEASFRATQRIVDSLTPAMAPLARGLSAIVKASADLIPGFSGAEQMGARFEAWAQRISTDGSLKRWLDGAVDAAKALGSVFEGAGRIVSGVFKAAADANGGNALKGLADSLKKVGDAINRPEIQTKLRDAFRRANEMVSKVVDLFVKLLPFIVDMAPYVMALAAAWKVFAAATALWKGAQMVKDMGGLFTAIKGFASGPVGWVILAIVAIGAAFVYAYKNSEEFRNVVDTVVRAVSKKLGELWQWLQDTFGPIWDAIKAKASEWGPVLLKAAQDAWGKLQEVWAWLVETFGPVWEALKQAASAWGAVAVAAFGWLWQKAQEVWAWVQENLVPIWDEVKGPLLVLVRSAVSGFAQMLYAAAALAKWIAENLGPAWDKVRPAVEFLGRVVGQHMMSAGYAIRAVIYVVQWLKDMFDAARGAGASIGGAISGALSGAIGWIQSAIRWAGRLRSALSNMPGPIGGMASLFGSGGMFAKVAVQSTLPEVGMPFYMTAAALTFPSAPVATRLRTGPTYVYNVTVEGAIDPATTARHIEGILARSARRDGRAIAGASTLWGAAA